jgi:hypothetical protein
MSYGTPSSSSANSKYTAGFTHTNGDRYTVTSEGYGGTGDQPTESERDDAFQDIVDLLNDATDLTCPGGSKTSDSWQEVTPTS